MTRIVAIREADGVIIGSPNYRRQSGDTLFYQAQGAWHHDCLPYDQPVVDHTPIVTSDGIADARAFDAALALGTEEV